MGRGAWQARVHGIVKELAMTEWLNKNDIPPYLLYPFPVGGHLGCFCVLAVVSSAAVDTAHSWPLHFLPWSPQQKF